MERLSGGELEKELLSERGSFSNGSADYEGRDNSLSKHHRHGSSGYSKGAFNGRPKWSSLDKHRLARSASATSFESGRPDVCHQNFDFLHFTSILLVFS